jgi:hypothetical protein
VPLARGTVRGPTCLRTGRWETRRPPGRSRAYRTAAIVASRKSAAHGRNHELTIVDRLLVTLFDKSRNVPMAMREAGHTQDEISAAWREARAARFTESTGLGMERLTAAGKARAAKVRSATDS